MLWLMATLHSSKTARDTAPSLSYARLGRWPVIVHRWESERLYTYTYEQIRWVLHKYSRVSMAASYQLFFKPIFFSQIQRCLAYTEIFFCLYKCMHLRTILLVVFFLIFFVFDLRDMIYNVELSQKIAFFLTYFRKNIQLLNECSLQRHFAVNSK